MAHAEKCPICYGEGKIMDANDTATCPTKTCHGCAGCGWVQVQGSEQAENSQDRAQVALSPAFRKEVKELVNGAFERIVKEQNA